MAVPALRRSDGDGLLASGLPHHAPAPPVVRWSVLIGELVRLSQALPARPPPRRRLGETPPPPAQAHAEAAALLDGASGHVVGLLSRCCALGSLTPPAGGAEELEARIMLAAADHLLGWRLDWAGRDAWRRHPLSIRLLGGPALDDALRTALHARLAAGEPRFVQVLPALLGLGLGDDLFPDERARRMLALLPAAPAQPAPSVAGTNVAGGPRRWPAAALPLVGLLTAAGLIAGQHLLWQDMVMRLAGWLAGQQ